jgi:hypothetical protein
MDPAARPAPSPPAGRGRGSGRWVVAAMFAVAVALAFAAKAWRVPGAVPQVRLFPAEEEIHEGAGGWALPPGESLPPRLVARLRPVDADGGAPLAAAAGPGSDAEGLVVRAGARGIVVELPLERRKGVPRPRVEVEVRVEGRPAIRTSVPLFPSTRADALDAPAYRVRVPR